MCVIYACWDKLPADDELEAGSWSNSHGAGICWLDHGEKKIRWLKGMKSDVEEVKKALTDNKVTYPCAIHFRSASIGGVSEALTHPFPMTKGAPLDLTGSTRRVMMHNGHIADWKSWLLPIMLANKDEIPYGPWSDSRALALATTIKGEGLLEFVIGTSRVLVLDSLPSMGMQANKPRSYIRLFGSGWDHKDGYAQSSITTTRARSCKSDRGGERRSVSVYTGPAGDRLSKENVWSVDELEALLKEIREEQAAASQLLGN